MPRKIAKNYFHKGMNKDVSPLFINNSSYLDATNYRLSVNEDSSLGTLENVKGNELLLDGNDLYSSDDKIVGSVILEDKLILFTHRITHASDNNISRIQLVTFNGDALDACVRLWDDYGKADEDKMNFNVNSIIKAVSRKEADDIEKIYWVDDVNYLRFANISDYLTDDGLVKSGSNDFISAKAFGTVASVVFDEPSLISSSGGGLNVGVVQYAYQLYNKNGSETAFSPATGLFHLTSSSDSGSDSSGYSGNAVEDESGKSFTFDIELEAYDYDSIRIVSIHYEHYQQLPTINIIAEKTIPESGIVQFTDRGAGYIGSYTIEQFTALAGLYKAKDIASSKNYLFLANVTENYFNIGDYDARAYRFNDAATKRTRLEESDGTYYVIGGANGGWVHKTAAGATITDGSNWTVPETADLSNPYNDTTIDGDGTRSPDSYSHTGEFIYKKDSSSLGGDGPNIEYIMKYDLQVVDDNAYPYTLKTSTSAINYLGASTIGWEGSRSPFWSAYGRSYQRMETYRFGIIFFDKFGRQSVVKWIGDIRMPDMKWKTLAERDGNDNRVYSVYPRFTINNYPDEAVGFKIVRVEREAEDKSVVMNGIVRPTGLYGSTERQPHHNCSGISSTVKTDLQEFISPEISFYKDFTPINNDYLVVDEWAQKIMYDLGGKTEVTTAPQDGVVKCRKLSPYYIYVTSTITDGAVVLPGESGETTVIGGITYRPYFDEQGGGEEGYKGTSLIFAGTNTWSYTGGNNTDQAIMHASYRRHIFEAQYGGPYYASRAANEYIGASTVYTVPSNRVPKNAYATQGDTFIGYMDHTALHYNTDASSIFFTFLFPVESSINVDLRHDDCFTRIYAGGDNYRYMDELGNPDYDFSEMYLYNTVYSQENNNKVYFPQPFNEDPAETKEFNTRILVSEKKFNAEESDSWLTFLTNNFIDVDANHGELNNIMDYNNNLLFWQPRGFGMTDVDPRSLITDSNPGALVLGTGAVLSRFDYLSTMIGNSDDFGITLTPRGIYWYDSINNILVKYDGKTIDRLSKTKGLQSYMNDNKYDTMVSVYHPKYDEVLFSFSDGTGSDSTLAFNEFANVFTSLYSFDPIIYINVGDRLISTDDKSELWIHDTSNSNYACWYGGPLGFGIGAESTLKIAINEDIDTVKVFDSISYSLYSYDSDNVLQYNHNFTSTRCYNSYQNTNTLQFTLIDASRKKGLWSFHVPRNAVDVSPDTEPDIFDSNNLDLNRKFRERMRDTYMVTDFTLSNAGNNRVNIPFINTKYRINYR